jgi:hypothetical protein
LSGTLAAPVHPAFALYRRWLVAGALPELAQLNAWALDARLALPDGKPLRFLHGAPASALAYESAIAHHGIVHVRRGQWHDALNALVWLAFPKTKAALNARHVQDRTSATANQRSRGRDAATLLDESGLILVCGDPDLDRLLRERAWRALFDDRRSAVMRMMQPYAIGHGMLVKLLAPFRAITPGRWCWPSTRERCRRAQRVGRASTPPRRAPLATAHCAPRCCRRCPWRRCPAGTARHWVRACSTIPRYFVVDLVGPGERPTRSPAGLALSPAVGCARFRADTARATLPGS